MEPMKARIALSQELRHAGQDQHLDGIEAHGRQGIDFLAHFHRAKFGGIGTPGSAGDHNGNDQDANFAEYEDADQIDNVGLRAELAEMEDALLGDDGADQKRDQGDDRYGLPANLMQVIDEGDFSRSERGLRKTPKLAEPTAPSICRNTDTSSAELNVERPTASSRARTGF